MNLKLSFIIQTSQKMQTVVHFRYPHVVKWQVCVSFVCFDSKLCYSFAFLSISYYYLSAYLPICIYLKEKWRRSYWMLKSSWPGGSKVILPRNSVEFCLKRSMHAIDQCAVISWMVITITRRFLGRKSKFSKLCDILTKSNSPER